jgi:hypothetical protein
MKMTVVPAQVTTVEDRIIGNLGFSQILLLVIPIFICAGVFLLLPPFMGSAIYKYILMGVAAMVFCILAVRIKGKIVALWLVTLFRYNSRPKYYLYNKNVTTHRENYSGVKDQQESQTVPERKPLKKSPKDLLDIPTTAYVLATLENPATRLRFETTKKGDLHVRLKKIEEND